MKLICACLFPLASRRTPGDVRASAKEWGLGDVRHPGAAHTLCGGKEILLATGGPAELREDHFLGPADEALPHGRVRTKAVLRDGPVLGI